MIDVHTSVHVNGPCPATSSPQGAQAKHGHCHYLAGEGAEPMTEKTAFLFPGQGSQFLGMGQDLAQSYSVARDTFAITDREDHPIADPGRLATIASSIKRILDD